MAKTKISEFSATPANNTDIDSINIAEGCAPSGINDAIRELMSQLKDFQTGAVGDSFNGPVGTTTAAAGAFTTLTTSSTVTLNGGTANGVPYLNGSKVLTSGSALTFNGTLLEVAAASATAVGKFSHTGDLASGAVVIGDPNTASSITGIYLRSTTKANINFASGSVLAFNNAGDGSSELMRLTSTGLGIGTSSPAYKLDVFGSGRLNDGRNGGLIFGAYSSAANRIIGGLDYGGLVYGVDSGSSHNWHVNASTKMTLNANGQLLIGATSAGSTDAQLLVSNGGANGLEISATAVSGQIRLLSYNRSTSAYAGAYYAALDHKFDTGGVERARIDSSGNLLVGTTSAGTDKVRIAAPQTSYNNIGLVSTDDTNSGGYIAFRNSATTEIGSIKRNGASAVSYNTTSDHRLKTVLGSITDSGARIDALEPIEYEWKVNGERTRGFLAHKFQEVYAGSVTGSKDAVDKEGKPVYQAMQAGSSEVIADLVAEIQSLRKRLAALESK